MKVFQIVNGWCYNDMTAQFPSLEDTNGKFSPDIVIVETPDYVYEGWGYDEMQEGEARFIQPQAPEGWLYDTGSGTFYPEGETAPSKMPTTEEKVKLLEAQIEAQNEQLDFYEECIAEMAMVVYA